MNTPHKTVEGAEENERKQASHVGNDPDRPADVHSVGFSGSLRVHAGARFVDGHQHEVHERERGKQERENHDGEHAAPRNEETTDDRGGQEADAGHHADESIGLVAAVLWYEQRHHCRECNAADIAGNDAKHHENNE
jgi:hypothetical protein